MSTELLTELTSPSPALAQRMGFLRADLDKFTEGQLLSVGQHPFKKKKTAYLCRLSPPMDEVWEIRSCDPRPGIRVFGRFCEYDTFLALMHFHREDLGGPDDPAWPQIVNKCKAEWRKLFPTYDPHTGDTPHDYVSNIFLV